MKEMLAIGGIILIAIAIILEIWDKGEKKMKKALTIGGIILIILAIIFEIWVSAVTYANKPINEIPFWVLWLLH